MASSSSNWFSDNALGLINAGIALGSSVYNTLSQKSTNKLNVSTQKALLNQQNAFSEKQAALERAYNSPANQLRLMQLAGINPNMMAQGTGFAATSQASVPSVPNVMQDAPQFNPPDIAASVNQAASANSSNAIARTENMLREGKGKLQNLEFDIGNQSLKESNARIDELAKRVQSLDAQIGLFNSQRWLNDSQTSLNDQSYLMNPRYFELAWNKGMQDIRESSSRIMVNQATIGLIHSQQQQIKEFCRSLAVDTSFKMRSFQFRLQQEKLKAPMMFVQIHNDKIRGKFLSFNFGKHVEWFGINKGFELMNKSLDTFRNGIGFLQDANNLKNTDFNDFKSLLPWVGSSPAPNSYQGSLNNWNPSFSY